MARLRAADRLAGAAALALLVLLGASALLQGAEAASLSSTRVRSAADRAARAARRRLHGLNDHHLHRHRSLMQATAVARSQATAEQGGTAVSDVRAGAVSTGPPATAVAQGASVAQAGQTVITQCEVYARDSEQYKVCIGTPQEQKSNVSANATAAAQQGVVSWEAAPTCAPPVPANAVADNQGRLWGFQNGSSCAYRFADGSPVTRANATAAAAASATALAGASPAKAAPPPSSPAPPPSSPAPTPTTAAPAAAAAASPPPSTPAPTGAPAGPAANVGGAAGGAQGAGTAGGAGEAAAQAAAAARANATAAAGPSFADAPACAGKPTPANSTADLAGRLWGFQNGASCAYKDPQGNALSLPASPSPAPASPTPAPPTSPAPSSPAPSAATAKAGAAATAQAGGGGGRRRLHVAQAVGGNGRGAAF